MAGHDIIVVGASAGGVEALKQLVSELPGNLPASIFVVLHISPHGRSVLPDILSRKGTLPAFHPLDGRAIEKGQIYVAPPDHHLTVHRGYVILSRGPKENGHRPAVDTLFRSAARAYGRRVVGVVLSGVLDDGTAGLAAIKMRQGIAVVQDPEEALYSGMPLSAIENVAVDHVLSISEIASLLARLAQEPVEENDTDAPKHMEQEVDAAEMNHQDHPPGVPASLACPACGGTLWELHEGDLIRFRCRIGHAFTAQTLLAEQADQLEEAFWVALRALEESASLAHRMAERARERGQVRGQRQFQEQAQNAEERARLIRQVLEQGILMQNPGNLERDENR